MSKSKLAIYLKYRAVHKQATNVGHVLPTLKNSILCLIEDAGRLRTSLANELDSIFTNGVPNDSLAKLKKVLSIYKN